MSYVFMELDALSINFYNIYIRDFWKFIEVVLHCYLKKQP